MTADKDAAAEARRAYYAQWRRKNPDRIREYNLRYWMKYAERASAEQKKSDTAQKP